MVALIPSPMVLMVFDSRLVASVQSCIIFCRFNISRLVIPTLAIAGSLARKKRVPASDGTLPTHQPLFVVMLISVVIIVGALTFFPKLALGPIVEHFMMIAR